MQIETFYLIRYPISYILIFVLVVTAVLQIKYLNKALQRFDSTEVIPTQFVLFTVSAIIGSAVLYHDFDDMDVEQLSRFMSGCAIEFLGVYLITSKRTKKIGSPALSISADSGTAISYSDEEALDRVTLLPSDQQQLSSTFNNNRNRKRTSDLPFTRSTHPNNSNPPATTFEAWQEANSNIVNSMNIAGSGHRRHSSVFRGISMASQLMDRSDENGSSGGSIQLPTSSPSHHHRRNINDASTTIGNLISGITSAITSSTAAATQAGENTTIEEADAVEIEIPTPSSFHHGQEQDQPIERELMPLPKRSSKLVDIEEELS